MNETFSLRKYMPTELDNPDPQRPNIVFIFSDQQRSDTCGCYGQPLNITPNLDQMAHEGVLFENAFTCQPVCGPARACLQTGKYATATGCYRNGIALPLQEETIAKLLRKNKYHVGYIGKWHLASTLFPSLEKIGPKVNNEKVAIPFEYRGGYNEFWLAADILEFTSDSMGGYMFDENCNKVEFSGYRVDQETNYVLDYLEQRKKAQKAGDNTPFFLFVSYLEPHHQNNHHHYEGPPGSKEKYAQFIPPEDLRNQKGDWQDEYPDYLGCCNSLDSNLKRIHDKLEELGLNRNTVVIYTSDHGSHFKTRNMEYKRSCHESSIHVPLVIKGGAFKGGKKISELVSLIDLPPTILDLAGIPIPQEMHGRSIVPLLQDKKKPNWQDNIFLQISESQVGRAIRTKKWKYSVKAPYKSGWLVSKSHIYMEEFLYDLETDPYEQTNLVSKKEWMSVRQKLSKILIQRMEAAGELPPKIIPWCSRGRRFLMKLFGYFRI